MPEPEVLVAETPASVRSTSSRRADDVPKRCGNYLKVVVDGELAEQVPSRHARAATLTEKTREKIAERLTLVTETSGDAVEFGNLLGVQRHRVVCCHDWPPLFVHFEFLHQR